MSIAGGCGCKISPQELDRILSTSKQTYRNSNTFIGFESAEDCAVYDNGKNYMLFTTDFFTPLIDDPYVYGFSAAANALSDIFAMGGNPLIASSILGYPKDQVPLSYIEAMIQGSNDAMDLVGCHVVGGHSIQNPQPIFGFSIIGEVNYSRLKRNNTAEAGDLLILTKPLGVGIYSNAHKLGLLKEILYEKFVDSLRHINSQGQVIAQLNEVSAMTDITGFGLIGHCLEMCQENRISAKIYIDEIPFLPETADLFELTYSPESGINKNYHSYKDKTVVDPSVSELQARLLFDPQSNGGLLISVKPRKFEELSTILGDQVWIIGECISSGSDCESRVFITK